MTALELFTICDAMTPTQVGTFKARHFQFCYLSGSITFFLYLLLGHSVKLRGYSLLFAQKSFLAPGTIWDDSD